MNCTDETKQYDVRQLFAYLTAIILLCCRSNSSTLPKEKYYQYTYKGKYTYKNDTLKFELGNPLKCPLRISVSCDDTLLKKFASLFDTVTLNPQSDTILTFYAGKLSHVTFNFQDALGDMMRKIEKNKICLPFPKGRTYKIIQGYNGMLSHNNDYSRFAIDFDLKINDTVCAADDGYVVGVITEYKYGGSSTEWKNNDKSNFITIYHPQSGLFTQYVHLKHNGSFVKIGDYVIKRQPIGLSGMTGYTTIPHLHFNVLKPSSQHQLTSTEIEFEEGYKGAGLIMNTTVQK